MRLPKAARLVLQARATRPCILGPAIVAEGAGRIARLMGRGGVRTGGSGCSRWPTWMRPLGLANIRSEFGLQGACFNGEPGRPAFQSVTQAQGRLALEFNEGEASFPARHLSVLAGSVSSGFRDREGCPPMPWRKLSQWKFTRDSGSIRNRV